MVLPSLASIRFALTAHNLSGWLTRESVGKCSEAMWSAICMSKVQIQIRHCQTLMERSIRHPCFWPFLAIPTLEGQLPLILVRFQRNSGESSGSIKKMTQKDNGPGPGRNYGETGVFTFGRKVVLGLKMGLTPKNHPKWHFPPSLFGQRPFFSLNNFFRSWPEHG